MRVQPLLFERPLPYPFALLPLPRAAEHAAREARDEIKSSELTGRDGLYPHTLRWGCGRGNAEMGVRGGSGFRWGSGGVQG